MLTHTAIHAAIQAEADARKASAIAEYEVARLAIPAAVAAEAAGHRGAYWQAADRLRAAERLVQVFVDREHYGAINDRIVARIKAEQAARR